jgi:hypothetical protein
MRELAMDLFNEFWGRHCPRVKPTRGYPHDARRFREEVDETRRLLGIDDLIFWRNR